jgi:hypothetical protein
MAFWLGWLAVLSIGVSALLPLGFRVLRKKRAAPDTPTIRLHVALGTATTVLAFLHTLTALPDLGSPAAVGGGSWALAPAGVAFCAVIAHAGIGLQLREPKLRERARKRRAHAITALAIVLTVSAHVWLLRGAD